MLTMSRAVLQLRCGWDREHKTWPPPSDWFDEQQGKGLRSRSLRSCSRPRTSRRSLLITLGALAVTADRESEQVMDQSFDLEVCRAYRQAWGRRRDWQPDLSGALLSQDGSTRRGTCAQ